MKITVLGSGTSQGIPIIGCSCAACTSPNPKDKRLRVSVFIETDSIKENGNALKILIDTSSDFRQQMLANKITDIDAVLYTHHHIDHIMGLDDIRPINQINQKSVDIYANKETMKRIKQTFSYIFDENTYKGGGIPDIKTHEISLESFSISRQVIIPLEYNHGPALIYGYRINNFAYMTDCSGIPEKEYSKLENLDVLILDALRYRKHPTHYSIDEAVESALRIGAKQTYFTHMTHDILHDEVNQKLPKGIELAYDGLVFETT